nr:uncharacterized protein LOC112546988 isoform X2 [Pelodiscus sinensis]|eukprot:XP_025044153.1 uncharacterized protein LOC112546988 isoform X2 [Pelodiscus sinensis]
MRSFFVFGWHGTPKRITEDLTEKRTSLVWRLSRNKNSFRIKTTVKYLSLADYMAGSKEGIRPHTFKKTHCNMITYITTSYGPVTKNVSALLMSRVCHAAWDGSACSLEKNAGVLSILEPCMEMERVWFRMENSAVILSEKIVLRGKGVQIHYCQSVQGQEKMIYLPPRTVEKELRESCCAYA